MAVKMKQSYHLDDEDKTEVEMENVVKGECSGGSLVSRVFLLNCSPFRMISLVHVHL